MHIGLTKDVISKECALLNTVLADEFVLYIKTLNFHWHVTGQDFYAQHLFFKKQYEELLDIIDDIAERIRSLNQCAVASCQEILEHTSLKETKGSLLSTQKMLSQLLSDHEALIKTIRDVVSKAQALGDEGTANFMTDIMEKHEKTAWMLRASIK